MLRRPVQDPLRGPPRSPYWRAVDPPHSDQHPAIAPSEQKAARQFYCVAACQLIAHCARYPRQTLPAGFRSHALPGHVGKVVSSDGSVTPSASCRCGVLVSRPCTLSTISGDLLMNKSLEDIQRQIELQAADQKVLETILRMLIGGMLTGSERRDALFHSIRDDILETFDKMRPITGDPQAAERHKQLTRMRAEKFFQVLGEATGIDADEADRSTAS